MVRQYGQKKIYDRQRNIGQICESKQFMFDQDRKRAGKRLTVPIQGCTFSLRDEIGLCPNIEIEINVTDKSPFFIRPFHANQEDKVTLDKEMK